MSRNPAPALLGALLLALSALPAALAQDTEQDLRDEIEALKQGQRQIQSDLAEIKKLLQARPRQQAAPAGPDVMGKLFELGANPVKGARTARLTLVEFTDYQ